MDRDNDPAAKTDLQEPVDGGEDESFQEIMQLAHEPNPPRQLDLEIPTLNQPRPQPFFDCFQDPPYSQFARENGNDQAGKTDVLQEPVGGEDEGRQPEPPPLAENTALQNNLPESVDREDEDLLRHTLGTRQPQPEPNQPVPWPIQFHYYPYPPPSTQAQHSTTDLSAQNPTLVQPLMPPHHAEPENPPRMPVKRGLPAPRRGDQSRRRSEKYSAPKNGKSQTIPPPFLWATDRRATVHDLKTLAERGIADVSGDVCCTHCGKPFSLLYNIVDRFSKLRAFVEAGKDSFNQRAPEEWTKPVLPDCRLCGRKNCTKPVIAEKKKSINWLFLLLGSLLGLCSLEQLKYFCKHTLNHRTGAKDRVLYLAYLGLCKQLDETGPFKALD